jgi:O-antigen/teichoic acid export membrane protein
VKTEPLKLNYAASPKRKRVRLAGLIVLVVLFLPVGLAALGCGVLTLYFGDDPKGMLVGMSALAIGLVASTVGGVAVSELIRACRNR